MSLAYVGISVMRWRMWDICNSLAYMGYLYSAGVYEYLYVVGVYGISVFRWRIWDICIALAYMGYPCFAGVYATPDKKASDFLGLRRRRNAATHPHATEGRFLLRETASFGRAARDRHRQWCLKGGR